MTVEMGSRFLATTQLLFCAKDVSGQVNFWLVCLVLLLVFVHFQEIKINKLNFNIMHCLTRVI